MILLNDISNLLLNKNEKQYEKKSKPKNDIS